MVSNYWVLVYNKILRYYFVIWIVGYKESVYIYLQNLYRISWIIFIIFLKFSTFMVFIYLHFSLCYHFHRNMHSFIDSTFIWIMFNGYSDIKPCRAILHFLSRLLKMCFKLNFLILMLKMSLVLSITRFAIFISGLGNSKYRVIF